MNKVFTTAKTITFRETDAAGIMFFGNIFSFAHDVFEEFIREAGYSYDEWFNQRDILIPIRQTEAQFLSPFFPGKTYSVEAKVVSIGNTSFKMHYRFFKGERTHSEVFMVHALVNGKTKEKMPLPEIMKQRLTVYLHNEVTP